MRAPKRPWRSENHGQPLSVNCPCKSHCGGDCSVCTHAPVWLVRLSMASLYFRRYSLRPQATSLRVVPEKSRCGGGCLRMLTRASGSACGRAPCDREQSLRKHSRKSRCGSGLLAVSHRCRRTSHPTGRCSRPARGLPSGRSSRSRHVPGNQEARRRLCGGAAMRRERNQS